MFRARTLITASLLILSTLSIVACGSGSPDEQSVSGEETAVDEYSVIPLERCGGIQGLVCREGKVCVDDPSDSCDPENGGVDCIGFCRPKRPEPPIRECGGIAGRPCPSGFECVDNPKDNCDPKNGGSDCSGICLPKMPEPPIRECGGIAGRPCPIGFECIDNPADNCDPKAGGSDCSGICRPAKCDPTRICPQVVTCIEGQLYPTGCGPSNCDKPTGPCAPEI